MFSQQKHCYHCHYFWFFYLCHAASGSSSSNDIFRLVLFLKPMLLFSYYEPWNAFIFYVINEEVGKISKMHY